MLRSKKIFITPFLGTNLTVSSQDDSWQNTNTPNNDFQFVYPKVHYNFLQPFTFGVLSEYQWNRSRIWTGIIFSDATGASFLSGITVKNSGSALDELVYVVNGQWSARTATKIPISYSYKFVSTLHVGNTKSFFDIRLRAGMNLFLMRRWDEKSFGGDMVPFTENGENAFMIQPNSRAFNTIDGNQAGFINWECNLQKGWSLSFNAGFDIDWYIKNKRRITTSFYYEQGTRNVSAIVNQIYFNGVYQGSNIIYSRGSAIQFKLAFPIEILKKYTAKLSAK